MATQSPDDLTNQSTTSESITPALDDAPSFASSNPVSGGLIPPPGTVGQEVLRVGVSQHFHNKENRAPYRQECKQHTAIARHENPNAPAVYDCCWAFSRFKTTTLTPAQLVEHILDGKAWIPSTFGGNGRRTNENWQQAELIALDYDKNVSVADCMIVPLIRDHALLVHPSATSGTLDDDGNPVYKTRVIFRLDTPITGDLEYYRLAVKALGRLLGLPEDECSYKPAQLYYGSTNRIEQPHINLGALLPLDLIDAEVSTLRAEAEAQRLEAERRRAERNYQPVAKDSDRASRKIEQKLKNAYEKALRAPSDRTKAAYDQAYALAHYVTYWALTEDEIERTLLDALTANGAYDKYGSDCLRHIRNGISAGLRDIPEPLELPERQKPAQRAVRIAERADDPQPVADYAQHEVQPLKLWQAAPFMIVCPEYVLIEQHMLDSGRADDFTVADLAASVGCSLDKAQRMIKAAEQYRGVSERSAELMRIDQAKEPIVINSAERQLRGAAKARHYCLTPHLADVGGETLRSRVQELMEWGEPDVIRKDEAQDAALAEQDAERLETVTAEIARSKEAGKVTDAVEEAAQRKTDEIKWQAEINETRFTPNVLAGSVAELRVQLLEALIESAPDADWTHSALMWVVGVRRSSVGAVIRKSKYAPAPNSTFVPVKVGGKDIHRAVSAQCREKRGAPVAWLDAQGEVIQSFTRRVPDGAAGVLLNVGKKYLRRETSPAVAGVGNSTPQTERDVPEPTPAEAAQQEQERAEKRAQREMLPRMRGCMKARGRKFVPGPFGYWEWLDENGLIRTCANTFEGMKEALLGDYPWAKQQQVQRLRQSDPLLGVGMELGVEVMAL